MKICLETAHMSSLTFPPVATTPRAQEPHIISINPRSDAMIQRERLEAMHKIFPSRISEQSLLPTHRLPLMQTRPRRILLARHSSQSEQADLTQISVRKTIVQLLAEEFFGALMYQTQFIGFCTEGDQTLAALGQFRSVDWLHEIFIRLVETDAYCKGYISSSQGLESEDEPIERFLGERCNQWCFRSDHRDTLLVNCC